MSGQRQYMFIRDATNDNFAELVLTNSSKGPVLVNYWSAKVGPCIRQYPVLEKLVNESGGRFLLVNLNTDEYRTLAKRYGVTSLPTLKMFNKGAVVETRHGFQDEGDMRRMLAHYLPRPSDGVLTEAVRVYQQGDVEKSLVMLAEAILEDPQNIRLPLTMARLLVTTGQPQQALNLLGSMPVGQRDDAQVQALRARIDFILAVGDADEQTLRNAVEENRQDHEARYRLAALQVLKDEYDQAMQGFLEILHRHRQYKDGAARQALISVFSILGEGHELVGEYRKRLREMD